MELLALVPGLAAAVWLLFRPPAYVFVDVYIPTLFLLPDYYRWIVSGLPDPSFHHAAILPIVAVFFLTHAQQWRFSVTDMLVIGFAASIGYSEYLNVGYADAQNLLFDQLCSVIFVYVLAKGLIEPNGFRIIVAKRVVLVLSAVAISSLYEFKMAWNPYAGLLAPYFPWQLNWVTTFRWGFARVAGPYGHAILAGVIFAVGYRLQRWLEWGNYWETPRKARILTLGLAAGVLMTMCRGPWLGAACGAVVLLITRAQHRRYAMTIAFAALLIVGIPITLALKGYVSVKRELAASVAQETVAYRRELVERYLTIMTERITWGWGRNTWPRVSTMNSIDNEFLLLPIQHGLVALGLFLTTLFWMGGRSCWYGIKATRGSEESELALTFFAIYMVITVTMTTVYLGAQTVQLFFLMTGWAEGLLLRMRDARIAAATAPLPLFQFQRVLT
jgi:hypothetical protein